MTMWRSITDMCRQGDNVFCRHRMNQTYKDFVCHIDCYKSLFIRITVCCIINFNTISVQKNSCFNWRSTLRDKKIKLYDTDQQQRIPVDGFAAARIYWSFSGSG